MWMRPYSEKQADKYRDVSFRNNVIDKNFMTKRLPENAQEGTLYKAKQMSESAVILSWKPIYTGNKLDFSLIVNIFVCS